MEKKQKHMTLDDRIEIQECLCKGMPFKQIAKRIGKDQTTVSKEIKLHSHAEKSGFTKKEEFCPKLSKCPFVCNACIKRSNAGCSYLRKIYSAKRAQQEYETTLKDCREGIPLNKEEFYQTEKIISAGVRYGQNIYHIIQSNNLPVSKTTVYRHIGKGYYSIKKTDLPRAVKFKARKQTHQDYVPKNAKIGRTYQDYLDFVQNNPTINCVEMDTVIGRIGGKVIMTFQFVNVDFMFGILMDNKTAAEGAERIIKLKEALSKNNFDFGKYFPLLLTDNGGEFSYVSAFENNTEAIKETSMFFCDPNMPSQKPHVENNHTLFRGIVPKGSSFDDFTQETVNKIFSHINNVKREQFNGKSAYEMFCFTYSSNLAKALGISYVEPKRVIQNSKLLRD
ncbi:MAG: IS30 family transposase [Bacteroidales bacterium]|nr:IS30 family transposase [Bacteroidales bacterium]